MSPKICIVSEILHLKHKAQLPHIFIFDFEHNYWVPLQSYSVQVKSSSNFLDGSIVPSVILKIISNSLESLLVLFAQWDSEKFYFSVFSLSFTANSMYQFPAHVNTSNWPFELSETQVPSGSFPASFPGCLSVSTALADDISSVPPLRKGRFISSCSSSLWSSTATDDNKREVLLEPVANIPQVAAANEEIFKGELCPNIICWKGLYVSYISCYCSERLNEGAHYQPKCLWKLNPCLNEFETFNVKLSTWKFCINSHLIKINKVSGSFSWDGWGRNLALNV